MLVLPQPFFFPSLASQLPTASGVVVPQTRLSFRNPQIDTGSEATALTTTLLTTNQLPTFALYRIEIASIE